MDLETIEARISRGELVQEDLEIRIHTYGEIVEGFYRGDERYSIEFLAEETEKYTNTIRSHEEMYRQIDEALDAMDDVNEFRFSEGEKVNLDRLEQRGLNLISDYEELFDEAWEQGMELHEDPGVPDPVSMKYRQWRKERRRPPEDAVEKAMEGFARLFS